MAFDVVRLLPAMSVIPHPRAVVGVVTSAAGRVGQAGVALLALPVRVVTLLDTTELLVARLVAVLDRAEQLVARADALLDHAGRVVTGAEEQVSQARAVAASAVLAVEEAVRVSAAAGTVVTGAEAVAERAAGVVGSAAASAQTADELLDAYGPLLRRAAPMADRFVAELTHEEITAAIHLIDELPKLTHHVTENVLPILRTLDRVGPDIHELLEVTRDLRLAIAGIPGLGMLRRRGEDKLGDE